MSFILWCLIMMGGLGVLFGLGLALASRFFHVDTDPRIEAVSELLSGANCGACGYAGCEAYAEAVVRGESPDLCVVGGDEVARAVAKIMGLEMEGSRQAMRAVVHCQGGTDRCASRFVYDGIEDCKAANLLQGGPKACEYGCLGYGTCVAACPFDAITMGDDRIPVIDWSRCTGCGSCVKACPRGLIELVPDTITTYVACSSQDRGKAVKTVCAVGCISCWLCVKQSPEGAVEKNGNLPRLTYCEGADYTKAIEKCPMKCFVKVEPPLVGLRRREVAEAKV